MERLTEKELRYYGSPLNKFVKERCRKNMTVINADLITWDRDKKHIRFIESKHIGEKMGYGQKALLQIMRKLFKTISGYKVDVLVIRGNPPYNRASLEDIVTGKKRMVTQKELIAFLNYE